MGPERSGGVAKRLDGGSAMWPRGLRRISHRVGDRQLLRSSVAVDSLCQMFHHPEVLQHLTSLLDELFRDDRKPAPLEERLSRDARFGNMIDNPWLRAAVSTMPRRAVATPLPWRSGWTNIMSRYPFGSKSTKPMTPSPVNATQVGLLAAGPPMRRDLPEPKRRFERACNPTRRPRGSLGGTRRSRRQGRPDHIF